MGWKRRLHADDMQRKNCETKHSNERGQHLIHKEVYVVEGKLKNPGFGPCVTPWYLGISGPHVLDINSQFRSSFARKARDFEEKSHRIKRTNLLIRQ